MSKLQKAIEVAKIILAYIVIFGSMIIPIPLIVFAFYRLWDTDWSTAACVLLAPVALVTQYIGLYISHKSGRWFLENWGKKFLEAS